MTERCRRPKEIGHPISGVTFKEAASFLSRNAINSAASGLN